jgi:CheY-like chemotaxis protein
MTISQKTILHIEDEISLANLVKTTFEHFGFKGEILHVTSVEKALNLLAERERMKSPVDLILSDMHLPDGRGLDLLQHIKSNPTWLKTPVIILSGECSQNIINEAYALGANCYLSKLPKQGGLDHIRSLYQFWIERALVPDNSSVSDKEVVLYKSIQFRARIAKLFIELSKSDITDSKQQSFWLERAIVEGNLSSLLIFCQGLIKDIHIPIELTERLSKMQSRFEMALLRAEQVQKNNLSDAEKLGVYSSILAVLETLDEELVVEAFDALIPLNKTVSEALKLRTAKQLEEIANYFLTVSDDPALVQRANLLQKCSGQLEQLSISIN